MLRRRAAVEHCHGDTGAFGPLLSIRFSDSISFIESVFNVVQTLVESVAAEPHISGILPDRLDPIGGLDHVLATNGESVQTEQFAHLVNRALDCVSRLRCSIPPKATSGNDVGINGKPVGLLIRASIDAHRAS